jgi:RecJ-like exonuclease
MTTTLIDCSRCQGEGYILVMGQPGRFSSHSETYQPDESFEICSNCKGEGVLEVCTICLESLQILRGLEACHCIQLQLPKAA